ncbi:MAG: DHH family phosphoesterase [Anaerolineales bacterium]|nr:DHH family phosphoesterase [Anaerolineales bacterium]
MNNRTYVVGHVNPDTDSIASAIGYAWLLRERDEIDAIPARVGPTNPQTSWVLERLGIESPELLTDASPRFKNVTRRMDTARPDSSMGEAWAIANRTGGVAPVVNRDGTPYGLITGRTLFSFIGEMVGPHPKRQEMRIAELLDVPCHEATDTGVPCFPEAARIRDALPRIFREERNHFLVVDEAGRYLGVCRQREMLNPPRLRVVLVDHNEAEQALGAVEEAELVEILDHHRLGNLPTMEPIRFTVDVVGSTSTLISERIEEAGLSAPPEIAGILLAGLVSDTLILSSPTTTERDRRATERLGRWAFAWGSPLKDEDFESFGKQVLEAGAGLSTRDPEEILNTDLKTYEAGGYKFAVAQAEVTDLMQLREHLSTLSEALDKLRAARAIDFAMLMVTDVVRGSSSLLLSNPPPILDDLPYPRQDDGTRRAKGVVSRKKQLLPAVLGLLGN